MINIVGLGPGHKDYLLPIALKTLKRSDCIIGFKRAIESLNFLSTKKIIVKKINELLEFINNTKYSNISVIASGDPCYYGISYYLNKKLKIPINIVPGLSSFQYLTAKLGKSWNTAYTGSLHGRKNNFIDIIKNNVLSIWFTDKNTTPNFLCDILIANNISAKIYIGENLTYSNEKIWIGTIKNLQNKKFGNLCVVIVENEIF
jgi:cobalt-precorrin-7 (C5)-methyltransferase